jgi:GDP-L-fucose synthase
LDKLHKYGIQKDSVEIWGTGKPMREFLWSEEMADACVYVMEKVDFADLKPAGNEVRNTHINIGTGKEVSIRNLAEIIAEALGYEGKFVFNADKPDGTLRKLTDPSKLHRLGWHHQIEIEQGVKKLYDWYLKK